MQIGVDSSEMTGPVLVSSTGTKTTYRYLFKSQFYDSTYFTYDTDLRDIKFSWSKMLDEKYNSKLCSVRNFIKNDSLLIKHSELKNFFITSYEIKREKSPEESTLLKVVDRFIEDKKTSVH